MSSNQGTQPGQVSAMNHEELLQRLESRFEQVEHKLDKLESKIDKYAEQSHKNTTDLEWVKGSIKLGLTLILGIISTLVGAFFNSLKGG